MRETKASSKDPTRLVVRKRILWQFSIARRKPSNLREYGDR